MFKISLFIISLMIILSSSTYGMVNEIREDSVKTSKKVKPMNKVNKTEAEWKKELTEDQYKVLREKGTERPFTGKYDLFFEKGKYQCAACGNDLFESSTKFNSGCGWPSFFETIENGKVELKKDKSHGMIRTEVVCARCDSHLGHVFEDGPPPTGLRFCINSVALKFVKDEGTD